VEYEVADQLWRAAREALRNVDRHARATAAALTVRVHAEHVELEVADDGVGMVAGRLIGAVRGGHLGLATLREAMVGQGGTFEIGRRDSGGTLLHLTLPRRRD
jgi:signal transduction histidine kinase